MNNNFYGYQQYNPYGMYAPSPMPNNNMNTGASNIQVSYTNGLAGAKGYSIPPNTTMFLMDSDAPKFYIKTSDRNGMCTIKSYAFTEVTETETSTATLDANKFVTKEEFNTALAVLMEQKEAAKVAPAQVAAPKQESLL